MKNILFFKLVLREVSLLYDVKKTVVHKPLNLNYQNITIAL